MTCDPSQHELPVTVSLLLAESPCWEDYLHFGDGSKLNKDGGVAPDKQVVASKTIPLLANENSVKDNTGLPNTPVDHPVFTVPSDGVYFLFVTIQNTKGKTFVVHIEMQGRYGYLSAADWPLLP
ncbi:UNVERIFIED_CONTAM: hypothetical protein B566_EDAN019086, partial [Ephemera danica]